MKAVFILLTFTWLNGCKDFVALNNRIYEAQKDAVLTSPYKSATGAISYVDAQKRFRLKTLPKLIREKIFANDALTDTIYMTETFDEACFNCSSDWVKVLLRDTVYSTREEILGHKGGEIYEVQKEPFNLESKDFKYELRNSELIEIAGKIRKGESWTINSRQYGFDNCDDGDHTIVTVIYPDKKIEALYVRCWTPFFYRKSK